MSIGDNLKRLRRGKQWTQGDLAKVSGVKVGHISNLELDKTDNPTLKTIYSLINALECSPNALLNDVDDMNLDGRMAMVLEQTQSLPEREKSVLLEVIDKFCIAVSMQGLLEGESKKFLGINLFAGKTQELSQK
jgi:transcriptional regulator with XRE-family HTH domain